MSSPTSIASNQYRTHHNGQLTDKDANATVRLAGWVHSRRDHGGLIFIDIRDKWGITQLTFNPEINKEAFAIANTLRSEFVISVEGTVRTRPQDMINDKIATGAIELEATTVTILGQSKTPPFAVAHESSEGVSEEIRLKYRFLDLRHPRLQSMLKTRDEFITHVRSYMHSNGFTEVQTPILANSSPEGARDFLVPSRLYPGTFYALPQAPQQFKQLLMVGGLDRYFQIAPCFRDEDPRADRHAGDFYQIDLEMSFVEQEDIFAMVEPLMIELTEKFSRKFIATKPFPRLTWHEAMRKYGSDKPDLRFDLFITDVSDVVRGSGFSVFEKVLATGGVVHALHVPGGATLTRSGIEFFTNKAKIFGVQGLAYILYKDTLTSPIIKHLGEDRAQTVMKAVGAQRGDAVFFGADTFTVAAKSLGAVRVLAAEHLKLRDDSKAAWVWVTDFPMYEYNEQDRKIDFSHNPFSMPQGGMDALQNQDPLQIVGYQYDLALNGFEISSGAIRNHRPDILYRAFEIAGYSKAEVDEKFGGMIRAFAYGAPPHGGFAPGIDRLLMVLLDEPNIREIYAFPKDGKARDLMMNSPSAASAQQLRELHIELTKE